MAQARMINLLHAFSSKGLAEEEGGMESKMSNYWVVGMCVLAVSVGVWWWNRRMGRRGIPKGNLGWPWIGETLDFISSGYSSNPVSFMQKRQSLYGKVFKSHLLGRPIIVSTDAEVNKLVLQNDGRIFVPYYPRSVNLLLGETSILKINGNVHRKVHGLIGSFFKSPGLKTRIAKETRECLGKAMEQWKEGQTIYVQDETKNVAFQVLVSALMSTGTGEDLQFLKKEFREFSQGILCLPINLPWTRLNKSLKAKERLRSFVRKIIEDRVLEMKSNNIRQMNDVIDVLLNEINQANKANLSVDFVCGNVIEMMIPGEDSVPLIMTLAIKYLTDCPLALKHITEENIEMKKKKILLGESYEWSDYASLEFTQNVINETLRLANIVNGVWRKALKDVEIKGYLIPKGWCVLASLSSIHMDEDNYDNPFQFNPWRWQVKDAGIPNKFVPFGGGLRLCPGLEFARLEVTVFLHHFVTSYRWISEEDSIVYFPTVKMRKKMPIQILPAST